MWYMAVKPSKKSLTLNHESNFVITNSKTNFPSGPIFVENENDCKLHLSGKFSFICLACKQVKSIQQWGGINTMRGDKPVWKMGGSAIPAHKGTHSEKRTPQSQAARWSHFAKENRSNKKKKKGVFYEKKCYNNSLSYLTRWDQISNLTPLSMK